MRREKEAGFGGAGGEGLGCTESLGWAGERMGFGWVKLVLEISLGVGLRLGAGAGWCRVFIRGAVWRGTTAQR